MPARSRALRLAGTGPMPMTAGSTPATAVETMRASGRRPRLPAVFASASSTAEAPSLMPELFPAVTVPPSRNAGRRRASASADVSARGCSSRATTTDSPFAPRTVIGTICSSNRPASIAATAFRWLASPNASCRSRETFHCSATFSPVSPIE